MSKMVPKLINFRPKAIEEITSISKEEGVTFNVFVRINMDKVVKNRNRKKHVQNKGI